MLVSRARKIPALTPILLMFVCFCILLTAHSTLFFSFWSNLQVKLTLAIL